MASQSAQNLAQLMYLAYFNRVADPSGQNYWAGQIDSAGGINYSIVGQFVFNSSEFANTYPSSNSVEQKIGRAYGLLFNRAADSGGLAFYAGEVNSGSKTIEQAIMDLFEGAGGSDLTSMNNKIGTANQATSQIAANPTWLSRETVANLGTVILDYDNATFPPTPYPLYTAQQVHDLLTTVLGG